MTRNRHLLTAAIFTAALISPTMGTAQTMTSSAGTRTITGNKLHERAVALYETPERWRQAAHILRQGASSGPSTTPRRSGASAWAPSCSSTSVTWRTRAG